MIAIPVPPSSFSAANSLGYCRLLQTRWRYHETVSGSAAITDWFAH